MFNFDIDQLLGMLRGGFGPGTTPGQVAQPPQGPPRDIGQFTNQAINMGGSSAYPNSRIVTYPGAQRPAMNPNAFYRRPDFSGLFGGMGGMQQQAPNVPTPGVKNDPQYPVIFQ